MRTQPSSTQHPWHHHLIHPAASLGCVLVLAVAFALGAAASPAAARADDPQPQPQPQPLSQPEAVPATATAAAPASPPLSADAIRALITEAEADTSLEETARESIVADLRSALDATQRREAVRSEQVGFVSAAEEAPQTIERLRAELSQPPAAVQIEAPEGATLVDIRAALQTASAELDTARAEVQRLTTEASSRAARVDEIPRQLAELRNQLDSLQPRDSPDFDTATLAERATIARRRAERSLVEAQITRYEAEQASYRARQELLPLRRDRAQRRVDTLQRTVEQWQAIETQRVQAEAAASQREALRLQREAALLSTTLSGIAEQNQTLAAMRTGDKGVLDLLNETRQQRSTIDNSIDQLRLRVLGTIAKVDATGLSDAVGVLLRNELKALPSTDPFLTQQTDLRRKLGNAQYQLIIVNERLAGIRDVEAALPELVERVHLENPEVDGALVESIGRELLTNQVDLLRTLQSEYQQAIEIGADLDATLANYRRLVEDYRSFIKERVLWTRSVPGDRLPDAGDAANALAWLVDPAGWADAARTIARNLWPPHAGVLLLLALLVGSMAGAIWAKRALVAIAGKVRKFNTDRFAYTLQAVPLTALIAAPYPLLAAFLSGLLRHGSHTLTQSLPTALLGLGITLAIIEFVRQAVRPNGLADAHFRWPKEGLADFHRWLLKLEIAAVPVGLVTIMIVSQPNELWSNSLGRIAFSIAMLVLAAFISVAMAPWRVFAKPHLAKNPSSVLSRTRWLWYTLLIAIPLALAALAIAGWFYTAVELYSRVRLTTWMLCAIVLLHCLGLRWLLVERRKLLIERARQRREAAAAASTASAHDGAGSEAAFVDTTADAMDVPDIDAQTRRVVSAAVVTALLLGMYMLWADVLPALKMFQRVQVWPQVTVLEEVRTDLDALVAAASFDPVTNELAAPSSNGSAAAASGPGASSSTTMTPMGPMPSTGSAAVEASSGAINTITLSDIAVALIVILFTVVLSRNLPGLLEITVLKRLPLDAGARFAISAVLRYLLVIVGVLLAFAALGVSWNKVQWLVAALTFGLAFGLQEIFANFISGLIMFAERPVRVGDVVTVAGISGTVTQIRMRATTVRDWDYKELIIPNKVFITGQIVNWTLADTRIRITIPVGVAHESDVRLVQNTLLELAAAHEYVLSDPKPGAPFLGFGDSTLNFELRCFLASLDNMASTRSELHMRITERFRELGIDIAFPQRDLHIRSADPLVELLAKQKREAE